MNFIEEYFISDLTLCDELIKYHKNNNFMRSHKCKFFVFFRDINNVSYFEFEFLIIFHKGTSLIFESKTNFFL
jgi:hypothetical protein